MEIDRSLMVGEGRLQDLPLVEVGEKSEALARIAVALFVPRLLVSDDADEAREGLDRDLVVAAALPPPDGRSG